jgi:hypothetical protein
VTECTKLQFFRQIFRYVNNEGGLLPFLHDRDVYCNRLSFIFIYGVTFNMFTSMVILYRVGYKFISRFLFLTIFVASMLLIIFMAEIY